MIVDTSLNWLAVSSIEPLTIWASADHKLRIPNQTVDAGSLWRNTAVVDEDLVVRTDTGLAEVVPNLTADTGVGHTIKVGPDSC